MIVDRKQFISILKKIKPGIDSGKNIIEGSDTFIFDNSFVHSYNESVSISVPFPNISKEPISPIAIKAKEFFDLINRLKEDELKLILKPDKWIIKSGNAVAEFGIIKNALAEKIRDIMTVEKWNELPERFFDGIELCKFATNNYSLAGIFFQGKSIISTNGIRINLYELDQPLIGTFWVTDEAMISLSKLDNVKYYFISENWAHFLTEDGVMFSCKKLSHEKYPIDKVNELLTSHKKENEDITNRLPVGVIEAIDRAKVLSSNIESFDTVRLTFGNDDIEIFSQKGNGKYTERINWERKNKIKIEEPISIFIDCSMAEQGARLSEYFYLKRITRDKKESVRIVFKYKHGIQIIMALENNK